MFDIGFLELVLIGIIALIVLGPERLPKAARNIGHWVGKAKQSFNAIKMEIDRELKVQELQQQIEDQKNQLETQTQLNDLTENLNDTLNETKNTFEHFNTELNSLSKPPTESKK